MNEDQAKRLREPFPASLIGKLPRGQIELDYVGHAAVTDRLLSVDPSWTWEPMARNELGYPALVENTGGGPQEPLGLWGFITIAGVTRPAFGGGKNIKECISDLIRNGAMRFGVGLDLWSKEDLSVAREPFGEEKTDPREVPPSESPVAATVETPSPSDPWEGAILDAARSAWETWKDTKLVESILAEKSPVHLDQMEQFEMERELRGQHPRKRVTQAIRDRRRELGILEKISAGEPSPDGASGADGSGAPESPAEDPDATAREAYEAFT